MILMTEAQIGNWETYALRKSRNVALQCFETEWVATTLQVLGGLKVVGIGIAVAILRWQQPSRYWVG